MTKNTHVSSLPKCLVFSVSACFEVKGGVKVSPYRSSCIFKYYKHLTQLCCKRGSPDLPEICCLGVCERAPMWGRDYWRRMTHAQNVFAKVRRTFPAFRLSCRRHSCSRIELSYWFYVSWDLFVQSLTFFAIPTPCVLLSHIPPSI